MNEGGKRNGDFAPTGLKPDGQWHDEDQYRGNNSRPHLSHKDCHNKWNAESNQMKKRLQAKNDRLSEIYESMAEQRDAHGVSWLWITIKQAWHPLKVLDTIDSLHMLG